MGNPKKKTKTKNNKKSNWIPPTKYFDPYFEDNLRTSRPICYFFFVLFEIFIALLGPVILYLVLVIPTVPNSPWLIVGEVGAFFIGVGLFNFASIIVKKYFGHLISILSFLIGGILIAISKLFL